MKQIILVFFFIGLSVSSFSQNPSGLEGMKYQAVVRDAQGGILKNQPVSFRFSIIEGASVPVYIETHLLTTNEFGLVNLVIGRGSVSQGIFVDISWTVGSYFIEVEMDATGGSNYKLLSTSEVLSVPYAQFAGNVIYTDTSAINEIQTISLNNDTLYLSNGGFVDLKSYNTTTDLNGINARLDADSIRLNDHESKLELRRLADSAIVSKMVLDSINMQRDINKNKTDISNHLANDLDIDSTNEIQSLSGTTSGNNQTIVLDKSGGSVSFSTNDADSDTTNEIQTISGTNSGNMQTILLNKNGGSLTFPTNDEDSDTTNEIQTLTGTNTGTMQTISLNKTGGSVTFPINDADSDSTNEIQSLSLNGNILSIDKNGSSIQIDLSKYLDNRDSQKLTLSGDSLLLDSSSGVDLKPYSQSLKIQDSSLIRKVSISNANSIEFSVADGDTSSNNEIQSLSLSNDTLFLSEGGFVKLPKYNSDNGVVNLNQPLSMSNKIVVNIPDNIDYQVPKGKFLFSTNDGTVRLLKNNITQMRVRTYNAIFDSEYTLRGRINGYLVDSVSYIQPFTARTAIYKVPTGKIFVITSYGSSVTASSYSGKYRYFLNNDPNSEYWALEGGTIIVPGDTTINVASSGGSKLNGYLVDENSKLFQSSEISENQMLKITGDSLEISNGNKVLLPSKWDGTDSTIYTLKQVGIGTNSPDSSAILDLQSTSKGFLPPKMTKAQNNNVVNPSAGLLIYRTDTIPGLYLFQDSTWNKIEIQKNGSNNKTLIYTNDGF